MAVNKFVQDNLNKNCNCIGKLCIYNIHNRELRKPLAPYMCRYINKSKE